MDWVSNWESVSDEELARAVELLVSPNDLAIREVATTLLESLDFTVEDVKNHLASGCYLNDEKHRLKIEV